MGFRNKNRYIREKEGKEGEKILWIDALCMNQDDRTERYFSSYTLITVACLFSCVFRCGSW